MIKKFISTLVFAMFAVITCSGHLTDKQRENLELMPDSSIVRIFECTCIAKCSTDVAIKHLELSLLEDFNADDQIKLIKLKKESALLASDIEYLLFNYNNVISYDKME